MCEWSGSLQIIDNPIWRDEIIGSDDVKREAQGKKKSINSETALEFLFFFGHKNKSYQHFAAKMKEGGE